MTLRVSSLLFFFSIYIHAQVYSPKLLRDGQPDTSDLKNMAQTIFAHADANTPREKAEAIWRYFLTDGRFVKPGMVYHIAGWTYEEPSGEVLDPVKLLNSYGFGLCYHIAPLLEAMFKAGGFEDARCWFLTGHTVAEVFYDGGYHYFDSDMMGYNVAGDGPFRGKRVASVRDLERDPNIILGKLQAPDQIKSQVVDYPWYPADVRARAMGDLADLFSTTKDNYLYPYTRYSAGHTMDFELRPGEKLIRFFEPEEPGLFYLPYQWDGQKWTEFPREFAEYHIRTEDGPRSQKDNRMWATGRIEYRPALRSDQKVVVVSMPSPYVIIDARFTMHVDFEAEASLRVETSVDGGATWSPCGELAGVFHGEWSTEPKVLVKSQHGRLTAVSGTYGYLVRITRTGSTKLTAVNLTSRIQLNPRTLPAVETGENSFTYSAASAAKRVEIPAPLDAAPSHDLKMINESGQCLLAPSGGRAGDVTYVLEAGGDTLSGFDVGARFLQIKDGLAPDKLTAETRHTAVTTATGEGAIHWSLKPEGPFQELWKLDTNLKWRDGDPIDRLLLWPDVFRHVGNLPANTRRVYVKLSTSGPAIDNIRLAVYDPGTHPAGSIEISQIWDEGGTRHQHVETISAAVSEHRFAFQAGHEIHNRAIVFSSTPEMTN